MSNSKNPIQPNINPVSVEPVRIGPYQCGDGKPLLLIAGPCVLQSADLALRIAEPLCRINERDDVNVVFKASFDKANRTSLDAERGPGLQEGLRMLEQVTAQTGLPTTTDIHLPEQAAATGEVCSVLQIPAFLCRQTDLLLAAGKTGVAVNVKKGQFLAP
jgi:2-dehydro-3-deoxyphosphooctonate aldolase (KDO 8-P synthase)